MWYGSPQLLEDGKLRTHHRGYSDAEIDLVRKSFSGRYALRDHCFFGLDGLSYRRRRMRQEFLSSAFKGHESSTQVTPTDGVMGCWGR